MWTKYTAEPQRVQKILCTNNGFMCNRDKKNCISFQNNRCEIKQMTVYSFDLLILHQRRYLDVDLYSKRNFVCCRYVWLINTCLYSLI